MNRRTFLTSGLLSPFATVTIPIREVRKAIRISHSIEVHMIVTAHFDERAAEHLRRDWIGRPFEGFGEFYMDSSEILPLPPTYSQLPATLTHHNTTIGVAAEKRVYLVAAIRRGNITAVARMLGNNEDLMLDVLEHVANVYLPTKFESGWSEELLQAFIPTTKRLGLSVEESDAFWP